MGVVEPKTGRCENCGGPIEIHTAWHKYCSPGCRLDAWVVKRADKIKGGQREPSPQTAQQKA
jgi:hypothetical protein